jgi:hypothetical protein
LDFVADRDQSVPVRFERNDRAAEPLHEAPLVLPCLLPSKFQQGIPRNFGRCLRLRRGATGPMAPQHRLYFLPLPHGQGAFRPILLILHDLAASRPPQKEFGRDPLV